MASGADRATHALLFVLDGLRPDALSRVPTPHIDALVARGASSMRAQVTVPSVTLPCHASLFLSSRPERHGITTNTWATPVPPIPSLFEVAHRAGLDTSAFYTWEPLRDLAPPGTLDLAYFRRLGQPDERRMLALADAAAAYVACQPPGLSFVYLEATDQAGHRFGWMSDRYLSAVADCDRAVGTVLSALDRVRRLERTVIALTSDHGGHDHAHGTEGPADMIVPWVLSGPGVVPGRRLTGPLSIIDIAPSLLHVLGLQSPAEWAGQVVDQALSGPAGAADRLASPSEGEGA